MNILETYNKLYTYSDNDGKSVDLVISKIDCQLYIQKNIICSDKELYHYMKENPVSNTPRIYHIVENNNQLVILKEFIHMTTLEEYVLNNDLKVDEIRKIMIKIASVLQHLHHLPEPIIHCDINPTNIFYNGEDLYLNDFDIAKFYNKHEVITMGSPEFAAPEQFEHHIVDYYNDIYSLGMVYRYLLNYCKDSYCEKDLKIIELMIQERKKDRIRSINQVISLLYSLF